MRIQVAQCERCRLANGVRNVCIGGNGAECGGTMVVGEAPGIDEDKLGSAFQGATGRVLRNFIERVVPGTSVRYTNAVRCFPQKADVRKAIEPCNSYLWDEIERVRPERILALGNTAFRALTGEELPITQLIGGWAVIDKQPFGAQSQLSQSYRVSFGMHPSAQLHNRSLVNYWQQTTAKLLQAPPPAAWSGIAGVETQIIDDADAAIGLIERIGESDAKFVALDSEYNSKTNRLLCVGLATAPGLAHILPDRIVKVTRVVGALERLMLRKRFCAHNWKFDAHVLVNSVGLDPNVVLRDNGWWIDTSALRKLDNPEQDSKLELASWMVGLGGHKGELYEALGKSRVAAGKGRDETWGPAFERVYNEDPELVMRYCGLDTVASWRLAIYYGNELRQAGYWQQWEETFGPLGETLFAMETTGLRIDTEALDLLDKQLQADLQQQVMAIRATPVVRRVCAAWDLGVTADEFNPKSPPQMRQLLFESPEGLGVVALSKTKGGLPSTNKDVLKEYQAAWPVLERIAEFNRLTHKWGTYVKGYRQRMDEGKRIHTTYRQDVARTGRLSSRDPNVHNIPNRGKVEDKALRRVFLPDGPEQHVLEIDYSQIELREAADLSGDPVMMQCFLEEIDIHSRTAANLRGCDVSEVIPDDRRAAKPINFGKIYGQTAKGLMDTAKREYGVIMTEEEAEAWGRSFFKLYRGYRAWMIREIAEAKKRGCAYVYWLGKPYSRRWLAALGVRGREAGEAERQAVNTPVQGGSAIYMIKSLNAVRKAMREGSLPHVRAVMNTVHDSIWLSVDKGWEGHALQRVGRIMVSWPTLRVPLAVDGKCGPTLGTMEELGRVSALDGKTKPYTIYVRRAA